MDAYLKIVQELYKDFESFELTKIPLGNNTTTDALAALASTSDPHLWCVIPVKSITASSIKLSRGVCHVIEFGEGEAENNELGDLTVANNNPMIIDDNPTSIDWRNEIRLYIVDGDVPSDKWAT